ncbi:MAG: pilus assembly protein TadG-related protein [Chloroflexota bacterium]|nr:pilus assembly protein TadG-related protein [Chloroflexota bacterium]
MKQYSSEHGQSIVLIALALVGLMAFAALAIDGGMVYSDRRQAQNAADAAALAGAYAKIWGNNWSEAALTRAEENNFNDNGTSNTVTVNNPPASGPYAGDDEYVQVFIEAHVDTALIHFVYSGDVINKVEAVARAKPSSEMYFGNAVIGLKPDGHDTIKLHGGPLVKVTGGGIFSNSSHDCGYNEDGGPTGHVDSITTVASTSCVGDPLTTITTGAPPLEYPPPDWMFPSYTCDYNHNGISVTAGETTLNPGVHCVDGDFKYNGGTLVGHGVTIVMESGKVTINGNGVLDLSAPSSGTTKGMLFYLPMNNSGPITISGNSGQSLTGTNFAPAADINLLGTAEDAAIDCQFIGYTVEFGGNIESAIHYNADDNYEAPPVIEMMQ